MEHAFKQYYEGKRVLVTGDTGFKGSWLSIWLRELGADVTGYALEPPSEPNNFSICGLAGKIRHVHGDVRDLPALMAVFEETQPDVVFHLAAQALVRYSYEVPRETFETNVLGTINVLEAVRNTPSVRTLVVVTSDKCYENREQVWGYKENDPMGGDDPYSASKGAVEVLFRSYLKSFFLHREGFGGVSVRAGNVIGGGDWGRDRIVPDCIRALREGRAIDVRNPLAIRPWQHVLEPLSGYLWLGTRVHEDVERFSGGWNFGPADSSAKCVRDLVAAMIREWGDGAWRDLSEHNDHRLHEAGWLRLSCDKAHFMLPWSAVLSFEETMALTVKWYRYFHEYRDTNMYQYCVHQIREYTKLARDKEQLWAI
ncbi:MAG TPA: CDP-glucose 4,6-dehydratase [Bacteroidota bacterium]|nr:CDP-glucose 4,6-dehydratase [Bacteroidota bacterium]